MRRRKVGSATPKRRPDRLRAEAHQARWPRQARPSAPSAKEGVFTPRRRLLAHGRLGQSHSRRASRKALSGAAWQARSLAPESPRGTSALTTTTDTLLGGKLKLRQPKTGYRVNVDSLLLVGFAGERRVDRVVDLGAGVGALGLLALHRGIAKRALLIEADPKLVMLARENLARSGFEGEVRELDLSRNRVRDSAAPLVLCNPPYYPAHSHRPAAPSRA